MAAAKETPKRAPRRTDREIAQDKLNAARLKVEGMVKRETALAEELRLLRHARAAAEERRDYLAEDPALKVDGAGPFAGEVSPAAEVLGPAEVSA